MAGKQGDVQLPPRTMKTHRSGSTRNNGVTPIGGEDGSSTGVVAAEAIPEGIEVAGPLVARGPEGSHGAPGQWLQFVCNLRDERQLASMMSVHLSSKSGQPAIVDEAGGLAWTSRLQGARDCSEQNLELLLAPPPPQTAAPAAAPPCTGRYRLRVTRQIRPGEQLLVWFADTCGLQLGVPFLSVINIRAHHCYQCHLCQRKFLHPNVLKAHLMSACCSTTAASLQLGIQHLHQQHNLQLPPPFCLPPMPLPQQLLPLLPPHLAMQGLFEFAAQHGVPPPPDVLEVLLRIQSLQQQQQLRASPCTNSTSQHLPGSRSSGSSHRRPWEEADSEERREVVVGEEATCEVDAAAKRSARRQHSSSFDSVVSDTTTTPASTPRKPKASLTEVIVAAIAEPSSAYAAEPRPQSSDGPACTSSGIDLPSDTEPLDLIPRSLYTCKSNKGHLCIYCGKVYSRKYGLKIHLRTHTGYKPLKCRVCLRPFGDPSNLNKHIRLHAEGDTPYRCEFCSKVLVRRRDLERHQRSRHPDRMLAGLSATGIAK